MNIIKPRKRFETAFARFFIIESARPDVLCQDGRF